MFKPFRELLILDDLLFLGNEYEPIFDRLEILISLEYGFERVKAGRSFWSPMGRFGWKSQYGDNSSPLHTLIIEGKDAGASWLPLKAGLMGGSFENFEKISSELLNEVSRRPW